MFLASGFGALALGLAGFGLFGLLSYAVARRSSEFGIRMALGASRAQVQLSVVREALWLMLCGFLLGAPFVMLGGRLVSALFFGISEALRQVNAALPCRCAIRQSGPSRHSPSPHYSRMSSSPSHREGNCGYGCRRPVGG